MPVCPLSIAVRVLFGEAGALTPVLSLTFTTAADAGISLKTRRARRAATNIRGNLFIYSFRSGCLLALRCGFDGELRHASTNLAVAFGFRTSVFQRGKNVQEDRRRQPTVGNLPVGLAAIKN